MSLENQFLDSLNWRYATKRMNGTAVPADKLNSILEAARLAPTSFGLQPLKVLVIENEEVRRQLQPACWNQPQIVEGSHVLVFAVPEEITEATVDAYMADIAAQRGVGLETLEGFKSFVMGAVNGLDQAGRRAWATKQAYIAFSFAIAAAALAGVDATPMEGFLPEKVDEILGLQAKGLRSAVILTLGYRDAANDYMANAKKVRRDGKEFFEFI